MTFQIQTASSREVVWEGEAKNPRHARKQAAALLGRTHIDGPGYITVEKGFPEYYHNKTYSWI